MSVFVSLVVCGIEGEGVDKIECGSVSICMIGVFICLSKNYFKQKSIVTQFFSLFLIKVCIFLNKLFVSVLAGNIRRGFFYFLNLSRILPFGWKSFIFPTFPRFIPRFSSLGIILRNECSFLL